MSVVSTIKWINPRDRLPDKDGYYLIAWKIPFDESDDPPAILAKCFTTNLKLLSDLDFGDCEYPGFWDHQGDFELYEEDMSCIRYWAEMPIIKEIQEEN